MTDATRIKMYIGANRDQDLNTGMINLAQIYAARSGKSRMNIALQRTLKAYKQQRKVKVVVKEA